MFHDTKKHKNRHQSICYKEYLGRFALHENENVSAALIMKQHHQETHTRMEQIELEKNLVTNQQLRCSKNVRVQ